MLLGSVGATVRAADDVHVVHPTDSYPTDHESVQAAVDLGGSVLLKATDLNGTPTAFNFGPAVSAIGGRVYLTTDVEVIGEDVGGVTTTIRGGSVPFFGDEPVTSRIEGITFDGPLLSAIIIGYSTGTEIVGNHVKSVVGSELPSVNGVTDLTEGRGIKLLGNNDPEGAITGDVRIADNTIDDLHADLSDAIVFDAVAADVVIEGNEVGTIQSSGVLVINSSGAFDITDNVIHPGTGDPGEIAFGSGVTVVGNTGAIRIADNVITCDNDDAKGIHVVGGGSFGEVDGAEVSGNAITMTDNAYAAITLEDAVSHAAVHHNVLGGAVNHAIELLGNVDGSTAAGNELTDNDVSALEMRTGAVYLDRHTVDTHVDDPGGLVTDMGTANVVEGGDRFVVAPAQAPFSSTVVVPLPGPGMPMDPITAAAAELDVDQSGDTVDNARIEIIATPTAPGDVDLLLQRRRTDGSWFTVGASAAFDVERERLVARRQPGGRYRVLVHSYAGGPQVVNLAVTFTNQLGS